MNETYCTYDLHVECGNIFALAFALTNILSRKPSHHFRSTAAIALTSQFCCSQRFHELKPHFGPFRDYSAVVHTLSFDTFLLYHSALVYNYTPRYVGGTAFTSDNNIMFLDEQNMLCVYDLRAYRYANPKIKAPVRGRDDCESVGDSEPVSDYDQWAIFSLFSLLTQNSVLVQYKMIISCSWTILSPLAIVNSIHSFAFLGILGSLISIVFSKHLIH